MSVKQVLKEVLFGQRAPEYQRTTTNVPLSQGPTMTTNVPLSQGPSMTTNVPLSQGPSMTTNVPLSQGTTFTQPMGFVGQENVQVKQLPPDVQVESRAPVVREIIHPVEKHEVNPIIYREREQTEIRQVEQPIYETVRKDAKLSQKDLPAETRPVIQTSKGDFDARYQEGINKYKSSVEYAPVERDTITKPPVVIETIRKHIREEIQPVIYREVIEPQVIQETLPIYEKVVEPPVLSQVSKEPIVHPAQTQYQPTEFVHQHGDYIQRPVEFFSRPGEYMSRPGEYMSRPGEYMSRPGEYVSGSTDLGGKKETMIEITETKRPSSWGSSSS